MTIEKLKETIENIENMFNENELAYLSLTSKNEFVLRDKIAYKLYSEFYNSKSIISREYKRIDLAILDYDKSIQDIIEFKSMYTFDSVKNKGKKVIDWINNDFIKNEKFITDKTKQYEIVIATHPLDVPDLQYKNIVKYYDDIKRYFHKSELEETMDILLKNNFTNKKYEIIKCNTINAGQAFGIGVDILIWIISKKQ